LPAVSLGIKLDPFTPGGISYVLRLIMGTCWSSGAGACLVPASGAVGAGDDGGVWW
jgi:hypothetical protein